MARRSSTVAPQRAVLSVEQMTRGVKRLQARIADLEAFDPQAVQKRWDPEVEVLEKSIEGTLSAVFGEGTTQYRRYLGAADLDNGPVSIGRKSSPHEARVYLSEGKEKSLLLLRQAIRELEEEITDRPSSREPKGVNKPGSAASRAVFIVHGHKEGPREAVARFLQSIGYEPIILHERPNKGRTIITKFREEAENIEFAIVLMTPDDHGGVAGEATKPRARQNVIFELGFFIGALGPDRVAALVDGDVERPSDFDGVVYIDYDRAGGWQAQLGRELQAAGFVIDWNRVMGG